MTLVKYLEIIHVHSLEEFLDTAASVEEEAAFPKEFFGMLDTMTTGINHVLRDRKEHYMVLEEPDNSVRVFQIVIQS